MIANEEPPAPPAAWLAECEPVQGLADDRPIANAEAWGAVFGERGLIVAWRCERERRACVRRWYAERLWLDSAAVAACAAGIARSRPD